MSGGVSTPGHGQGEGPAGDKWSQTTLDTVGGAGANKVSGVPPGAGLTGRGKRFENDQEDVAGWEDVTEGVGDVTGFAEEFAEG